jgi:TctA family transporter
VSDTVPVLEPPDLYPAASILDLEVPTTFAKPAVLKPTLSSFRTEILTLITFINTLATLHTSSLPGLTSSAETMIAFSKLCSATEHRILSVRLDKPFKTDRQHYDTFVYEAARIAALMCMTYLFRQMTPRSAIFVNLQQRLRSTVTELESMIWNMNEESLKLLLWAVCVGSLTTMEDEWYVKRIERGMIMLQIRGLAELSEFFGCFVWKERMAANFMKVWQEIRLPPEAVP